MTAGTSPSAPNGTLSFENAIDDRIRNPGEPAMPYGIEPGAILELIIVGTLFDQKIYLTQHYIRDILDDDTIANGVAALDSLITTYNSATAGVMYDWSVYAGEDMKFQYVQGQWIFPLRYAYHRQTAAINQGVSPDGCMPQNLAAVITMQSDYGGRTGRGDKHIAGINTNDYEAGHLTPTGKSHVGVIGASLLENLTYTDSDSHLLYPCVYHRSSPAISRTYTHYTVQETVRTMARRTVGRGI